MQLKDVKIGQRVRYVEKTDTIEGLIGTCVDIDTDEWVTVEFDSPRSIFHTCMGLCKANRGYWCRAEALELVEDMAEDVKPISVPLNVPGVGDYVEDLGECIRGLDVLGLNRREISSLFGDILLDYFHKKALQETIKRLEGGSKGV